MLYPKNQEQSLSHELFRNPTSEYRGTPFWAWNNRLDKAELLRQIGVLQDMGMGGFHMHSRVGLDTPYLGPEFLQMVHACVDEAKKRNMLAWLYDEDRWPSGAAGGLVTCDHRYRARYLSYTLNPPADGFAPNREAYEAALAEGTVLRGYWLVAHAVTLQSGALFQIKALSSREEAEQLAREMAGQQLAAQQLTRVWHALLCVEPDNAWYNGQAYVNTLDPAAIRRFIEETHETYAKALSTDFGGTVPAIFTDEPQFVHKQALRFADEACDIVIPFTDDFPETYQSTYGSDLLAVLPELFWELPEGAVSVSRYQYHDHLAERFSQSFADQIGNWCKARNLMLTGHMMAEESLQSQTGALGDAMRSYRSFQLPGIDMLCDSREFSTAKQAQSAANQFGYPGVLSELYGVTNWDFPFRSHKMQGDWQAALGVSVRVHHLSWVSMEGEAKRDYPASINYQSPWHTEYRMVEDYFSRLNTALTRGRPHVRIAAIHPVESYWLHWGPFEQTFPARDELETNFKNLMEWLLPGQIDFDWISESLLPSQCPLSEAGMDPNGFPVGTMRYEVVLVPGNHTLRATTLERLEAFHQAGGTVIFLGEPATWVDAVPDERAQRLAAQCPRVPFTKTAILDALNPYREVSVWTESGTRHANLISRIRQDGEARWLFLAHAWDREVPSDWMGGTGLMERLRFRIAGRWNPMQYDAMTGDICPMPAVIEPAFGRTPGEGNANSDAISTSFETCLILDMSIHDSLLLQLLPGEPALAPEPETTPAVSEGNGSTADTGVPTAQTTGSHAVRELQDPVPVTLSEPNVLLLDMAEYRLDDGDWQPEEELLRMDTTLRKQLGLPLRIDAMIQPWVAREKQSTIKSTAAMHRLTLRFRLELAVNLPASELALERPEQATIRLDGESITFKDTGWFTDHSTRKTALPAMRAGAHVLEVEVPLGEGTNLEWLYLLGDFGVRVAGRHKTVTEPVRTLAFGDWTGQGLPFYAGNVTYHTRFEADGQTTYTLETARFPNPVLSLALDGAFAGRIAFAPYQLALGKPVEGGHALDITAFGNRFNAFGCVHLCNPSFRWFGTAAWRTEGASWAYEYQLKAMGLLVAPKLIWGR
jgi:hypothetical protein